ncbi:RlpA-like double-psi beta-barrel-protein domain-containing protein-containing protein [Abortiporus biennis]|nr:RlpA-like double-psi beta-barrel-protein domain-containing protein-containing protein [Abortiporus biennis]
MRLSTLFGASLLSIALPLFASAEHGQSRRHNSLARRARGDIQHIGKRFDNARLTFYDVGLGACGQVNVASDFIVALNSDQYGGGYPGPHCFEKIIITYNGKSTTATIMDECPGCPYGGLDLSRGLFGFFASLDEGVLQASWVFAGDSGSSDPPKTSSKEDPPAPKTTSTHHTTSSTPPPPPPTTSSTHHTTPTTTSHSETPTTSSTPPPTTSKTSSSTSETPTTTSSSSSSHSSSSTPSATPTPTLGPDTLNNINQAWLGVAALVAAGGQNAAAGN